jgi:hypothetical protein
VENKAKLQEQIYKTKPIRRIVLIDKSGIEYDENNEKIRIVKQTVKVNESLA